MFPQVYIINLFTIFVLSAPFSLFEVFNLKALDTFDDCQVPVFSLAVSNIVCKQIIIICKNVNPSKLQVNITRNMNMCVLSDA